MPTLVHSVPPRDPACAPTLTRQRSAPGEAGLLATPPSAARSRTTAGPVPLLLPCHVRACRARDCRSAVGSGQRSSRPHVARKSRPAAFRCPRSFKRSSRRVRRTDTAPMWRSRTSSGRGRRGRPGRPSACEAATVRSTADANVRPRFVDDDGGQPPSRARAPWRVRGRRHRLLHQAHLAEPGRSAAAPYPGVGFPRAGQVKRTTAVLRRRPRLGARRSTARSPRPQFDRPRRPRPSTAVSVGSAAGMQPALSASRPTTSRRRRRRTLRGHAGARKHGWSAVGPRSTATMCDFPKSTPSRILGPAHRT